ncbi:hypothetical protein FD754_015465, partial [Muntiacus muntjak]
QPYRAQRRDSTGSPSWLAAPAPLQSSQHPRQGLLLTYRAADQPDFPPSAMLLLRWPLLTRAQQGRAATGLKATQLCPTQASGLQSTDTTLSSRAPSAPLHGIRAAHCVPGRPAALQASAGHGQAPALVAMPDHPPDGLVHSPGCLLPVPVMPGEELRGGGAPSPWRAAGTSVSIKPWTFPKGPPGSEPSWPHAPRMSRDQKGHSFPYPQDLGLEESDQPFLPMGRSVGPSLLRPHLPPAHSQEDGPTGLGGSDSGVESLHHLEGEARQPSPGPEPLRLLEQAPGITLQDKAPQPGGRPAGPSSSFMAQLPGQPGLTPSNCSPFPKNTGSGAGAGGVGWASFAPWFHEQGLPDLQLPGEVMGLREETSQDKASSDTSRSEPEKALPTLRMGPALVDMCPKSGQVSQECTCIPGPAQEPILEAAPPCRTETPAPSWDQGHLRQRQVLTHDSIPERRPWWQSFRPGFCLLPHGTSVPGCSKWPPRVTQRPLLPVGHSLLLARPVPSSWRKPQMEASLEWRLWAGHPGSSSGERVGRRWVVETAEETCECASLGDTWAIQPQTEGWTRKESGPNFLKDQTRCWQPLQGLGDRETPCIVTQDLPRTLAHSGPHLPGLVTPLSPPGSSTASMAPSRRSRITVAGGGYQVGAVGVQGTGRRRGALTLQLDGEITLDCLGTLSRKAGRQREGGHAESLRTLRVLKLTCLRTSARSPPCPSLLGPDSGAQGSGQDSPAVLCEEGDVRRPPDTHHIVSFIKDHDRPLQGLTSYFTVLTIATYSQGPAGTSSEGASSVGQKLPPAPNSILASWPLPSSRDGNAPACGYSPASSPQEGAGRAEICPGTERGFPCSTAGHTAHLRPAQQPLEVRSVHVSKQFAEHYPKHHRCYLHPMRFNDLPRRGLGTSCPSVWKYILQILRWLAAPHHWASVHTAPSQRACDIPSQGVRRGVDPALFSRPTQLHRAPGDATEEMQSLGSVPAGNCSPEGARAPRAPRQTIPEISASMTQSLQVRKRSTLLAAVSRFPKVKVLVAQLCPTLCDPKDCSLPGSSPFPSPGDLPNPGIKPRCPALLADSLLSEPPGEKLAPSPRARSPTLPLHTPHPLRVVAFSPTEVQGREAPPSLHWPQKSTTIGVGASAWGCRCPFVRRCARPGSTAISRRSGHQTRRETRGKYWTRGCCPATPGARTRGSLSLETLCPV